MSRPYLAPPMSRLSYVVCLCYTRTVYLLISLCLGTLFSELYCLDPTQLFVTII